MTTPAPIHPSLPLSRWIEPGDGLGWANTGFGIGAGIAVFPGGIFLMMLHEGVWGAAGADRPFSILLAIAAWVICLTALFVLAWFMVTVGTSAHGTRVAFAAAAVTVAGTAVAPALFGTTGVLNGIGFALITLLAQAAWLVGAILVIGGWRIEEFGEDEVPGDTAQ